MSKIPENLYYTNEHEWVKLEGNIATVGITDFAQNSLGEIVFVELPESGEEFNKDASFGVVESIKSVSDLYMPLTGKVNEKNEQVEENPEQINEDAYGAWLIKLEVSDPSQVENLMNSEKYQEFCEAN